MPCNIWKIIRPRPLEIVPDQRIALVWFAYFLGVPPENILSIVEDAFPGYRSSICITNTELPITVPGPLPTSNPSTIPIPRKQMIFKSEPVPSSNTKTESNSPTSKADGGMDCEVNFVNDSMVFLTSIDETSNHIRHRFIKMFHKLISQ